MSLTIGELCAGYGGLGMGVSRVIDAEVAWYSEIDKGALKVLEHRFPGVPNIGDMTTVDWAGVAPVDIITAGFPCQPVSGAGKGLGDQDERWLWDEVHRAIREVRPGLVVLENVRGLVSKFGGRLFARVLGSLADIGYDAAWHGLPASEVGAPHGRWRIFIVATDAERGGCDGWSRAPGWSEVGRVAADGGTQGPLLPTLRASDGDKGLRSRAGAANEFARKGNGADLATILTLLPTPAVNDMGDNKTIEAWDEWTAKMKARHSNGNGHGKSLAIELQRVESGWGPYAQAVERWECVTGLVAPPPSDAVRVREFMMGLPVGWVTAVPGITPKEGKKALGNGVVPQQAAAAVAFLLGVLSEQVAA